MVETLYYGALLHISFQYLRPGWYPETGRGGSIYIIKLRNTTYQGLIYCLIGLDLRVVKMLMHFDVNKLKMLMCININKLKNVYVNNTL